MTTNPLRADRILIYSHDTYGLGHLRRCLMIAERLLRDRPQRSVLIATGSPRAVAFEFVPGLDLLKLPFTLTRSVRQARKVLREAKADVLVGFGGYGSIPGYLAARRRRIPVVVHEANKRPGIAKKVGARWSATCRSSSNWPSATLNHFRTEVLAPESELIGFFIQYPYHSVSGGMPTSPNGDEPSDDTASRRGSG